MTKEICIKIASIMGLEQEVKAELDKGATPNDALYEWDCPDTIEDAYRCRLSALTNIALDDMGIGELEALYNEVVSV